MNRGQFRDLRRPPSPSLTGIKLFKIGVQLSFESVGFEECSGDVVDKVSDSEAGAA